MMCSLWNHSSLGLFQGATFRKMITASRGPPGCWKCLWNSHPALEGVLEKAANLPWCTWQFCESYLHAVQLLNNSEHPDSSGPGEDADAESFLSIGRSPECATNLLPGLRFSSWTAALAACPCSPWVSFVNVLHCPFTVQKHCDIFGVLLFILIIFKKYHYFCL